MDSLSLLWKHILLGLVIVVSHLINFLDNLRVLNLPLFVVLLLEKLELFSLKQLLSSGVLEFGALNQKVSFLETGSSLFSLIFELRIEGIVDHVALMH